MPDSSTSRMSISATSGLSRSTWARPSVADPAVPSTSMPVSFEQQFEPFAEGLVIFDENEA